MAAHGNAEVILRGLSRQCVGFVETTLEAQIVRLTFTQRCIENAVMTKSLSSQSLGDSLIQRVTSLMKTPFDELSASDARERLELGSRRLRETLSSVPWYAKQAKSYVEMGEPELAYWKNFWMSGCNTLYPPVESSAQEVS